MLSALVRFSVRFRGVVLSLALLVLGYGLYDISRAGLDIFPEFAIAGCSTSQKTTTNCRARD